MLIVAILAALAPPPDDAPGPRARPAAMVLDLGGKAEIRPVAGEPRAAEVGDLLYPGERLAVPAGGSATLSILGAGARESIRPGTEATVGPGGCTPPEAVASRKEQPRAVAATMKNLRPDPGDGRKAGVGLRSGPESPRAVTPIWGSTVTSDRPALAWPPADKVATYRVRLLSGAGREVWRAEVKEPRLAYPEGREPLQPGFVYRWEVTDPDYRKVAEGEFAGATASEREQLDGLKALAGAGDAADRFSAALAYRRMRAYAEAIAAFESLTQDGTGGPPLRRSLAELYRIAGRPAEAESVLIGR